MADRGAPPPAPPSPDGWPAQPELSLALNGMGTFDWDLDGGLMHMSDSALGLFDLAPGEYDGRPGTLGRRVPPTEAARLDGVVAQALKSGSTYGAYFRVRLSDGTLRWTHTQARVLRDEEGRPYRILGVVRDATDELSRGAELERGGGPGRSTALVSATAAALAHARTVQDVIDVLRDNRGLALLGADSLVMGLVETSRIHLVAEGPAGSFVPGTRYTRIDDNYPMSEVVRTLTPRFIDSPEDFAAAYPHLWERIHDLDISSAVYLPLIAQARPIGALGLLYRDKRGFTEQERTLYVALGSSIGQSLARAMLFEQEHDIAEGLQQAMLPRRIPVVPGAHIAVRYRSARRGRDIGGDWYDVIPLPGGRIGAIIGDVQGHDTHAAAVMGQLRIVLRAYAAEGHSPATVMARASAFLGELDTDRFATCTYAEADLATGVVRLVRAGHLDPLVLHTDGSCRRVPVPGGLPLGLSAEFGHPEYPVTTTELDPGETLLLCTDGLVETPGSDLDDGIQLLAAEVGSGPADLQQLADRLCEVVEERAGEDDVALLLLRRRPTGAPQDGGRLRQHIEPGDPEALHEARRMVRSAIRAWDAGARADEIELVADELITNALLHTDGPATVTVRMLTAPERRVRIEVDDTSSSLPRRSEPGGTGLSGRGLLLVDRLADVWGVESRGSGKCVWSEFDCRKTDDS